MERRGGRELTQRARYSRRQETCTPQRLWRVRRGADDVRDAEGNVEREVHAQLEDEEQQRIVVVRLQHHRNSVSPTLIHDNERRTNKLPFALIFSL